MWLLLSITLVLYTLIYLRKLFRVVHISVDLGLFTIPLKSSAQPELAKISLVFLDFLRYNEVHQMTILSKNVQFVSNLEFLLNYINITISEMRIHNDENYVTTLTRLTLKYGVVHVQSIDHTSLKNDTYFRCRSVIFKKINSGKYDVMNDVVIFDVSYDEKEVSQGSTADYFRINIDGLLNVNLRYANSYTNWQVTQSKINVNRDATLHIVANKIDAFVDEKLFFHTENFQLQSSANYMVLLSLKTMINIVLVSQLKASAPSQKTKITLDSISSDALRADLPICGEDHGIGPTNKNSNRNIMLSYLNHGDRPDEDQRRTKSKVQPSKRHFIVGVSKLELIFPAFESTIYSGMILNKTIHMKQVFIHVLEHSFLLDGVILIQNPKKYRFQLKQMIGFHIMNPKKNIREAAMTRSPTHTTKEHWKWDIPRMDIEFTGLYCGVKFKAKRLRLKPRLLDSIEYFPSYMRQIIFRRSLYIVGATVLSSKAIHNTYKVLRCTCNYGVKKCVKPVVNMAYTISDRVLRG